jgi:cell division protein YceG involved in septum cleavage
MAVSVTRRRRQLGSLGVVVVAVGVLLLAAALHKSKAPPPAPPPPKIVRITIPEGETRGQIARIAASEGLTGSYLVAARRSPLLDPAHYGAPAGTPNLEGFLFPATYELYAGSPAGHLVALQLQAFEENFGRDEIRRAHELHIPPYQLLIVASMVEREALLRSDRPKVAAVIYNRLRLGMPLGIDATIRYALNDFSAPLTEAQLQTDSPYNTRTHVGLPPTPISNPGVAAIEAAAHPAHVPYLYYVNGADGCGELVFSTSSAEFERNAAAYREAVNRNGGREPTCRKK